MQSPEGAGGKTEERGHVSQGMEADEAELARMGYKQELKCVFFLLNESTY